MINKFCSQPVNKTGFIARAGTTYGNALTTPAVARTNLYLSSLVYGGFAAVQDDVSCCPAAAPGLLVDARPARRGDTPAEAARGWLHAIHAQRQSCSRARPGSTPNVLLRAATGLAALQPHAVAAGLGSGRGGCDRGARLCQDVRPAGAGWRTGPGASGQRPRQRSCSDTLRGATRGASARVLCLFLTLGPICLAHSQKLTRKLVHIVCGPGFLLTWLLFRRAAGCSGRGFLGYDSLLSGLQQL